MLIWWDYSEVLKRYASGDILVEADTIEEGREIVLRDFEVFIKKRYDYLFYDGEEEIEEKRELLRRDVAKTPHILHKGAVFIEGSA